MRRTIERELKLEPGDGFELPPLDGTPLEARLFTSTYYDTPSRSLTAAGLTLRRRVENGLSRWQLKLPALGEARTELEAPGGPVGPPPELRRLLAAHLRHGEVEPVATLRTRRNGVRVADGERAVADVTLDLVDVLEGSRSAAHFAEVEVELVDGDETDLDRLGRVLRRAGAKPSNGVPKVMRVLQPAAPLRPEEGRTTLERLGHLLAAQLRELERRDPGVRLGDDPEDVHRFRVATRRSRAIIRATRPLLGDTLAPLAAELKWLTSLLGPVRDLDVLVAHLRRECERLDVDRAAGETIVGRLEDEREAVRDLLLQGLDSERYTRLLDDFGTALASLPAEERQDGLRKLARRQLKKLAAAADRLGPEPTDQELHALRISAKRARYAAELAAAEQRGKKLARAIDELKTLQDTIGEHQDAVVAESRLRAVSRPGTAVAAGRLIERERARRVRARRDYPDVLGRALETGSSALR